MKLLNRLANVNDETWAETLRLFSGLLNDSQRSKFIKSLCYQNIQLGVECINYQVFSDDDLVKFATQIALENINQSIDVNLIAKSTVSLIILDKVEFLPEALNQHFQEVDKKSLQLIRSICRNSNKDQIIKFGLNAKNFIPDRLFIEFIFNSNFNLIENPQTLQTFAPIEKWQHILEKLIHTPENIIYFNFALKIREILQLTSKITDKNILDALTDIKNNQVFYLRCFFDFYNSYEDKSRLHELIKKRETNFCKLFLPFVTSNNDNRNITKDKIFFYSLRSSVLKESIINIKDLWNLRRHFSSPEPLKKSRRRGQNNTYLAILLVRAKYLSKIGNDKYKVIKEPDVKMVEIIWNSEYIKNTNLVRQTNSPTNKREIVKKTQNEGAINYKSNQPKRGDTVECVVVKIGHSHCTVRIEDLEKKLNKTYISNLENDNIYNIYKELYIGQTITARVIEIQENFGYAILSIQLVI